MYRDPFGGLQQMVLGFAIAILMVSLCLHWAAVLIVQVWPVLLTMAIVITLALIGWRLYQYRRDRWW